MALTKENVVRQILEAFGPNEYPGDPFLQGSFDGCEPYDEVSAFFAKTDWTQLDSAFLDAHYCALSFFSECGFRFFLPAWLLADLRDELQTADPLFHLWHGFEPFSSPLPIPPESFVRVSGGATLLNPRRYGAITWADHARCRLSVFPREEAQAIVTYMNYKLEQNPGHLHQAQIDAALRLFWLDRAENAPTRAALQTHVDEEARFAAALKRKYEKAQQ